MNLKEILSVNRSLHAALHFLSAGAAFSHANDREPMKLKGRINVVPIDRRAVKNGSAGRCQCRQPYE